MISCCQFCLNFAFNFNSRRYIKLVALSPQKYWKDPWNRFDFLVVLGSLPQMFGLVIKPGATIFRTFRLWRMFRMLKDGAGRGLTLVHFSAQPQPFLTQNTPCTPLNTPYHPLPPPTTR